MEKRRIPVKKSVAPEQRTRLVLPILHEEDFADDTPETKRPFVVKPFSGHLLKSAGLQDQKSIDCAEIRPAINKVDCLHAAVGR